MTTSSPPPCGRSSPSPLSDTGRFAGRFALGPEARSVLSLDALVLSQCDVLVAGIAAHRVDDGRRHGPSPRSVSSSARFVQECQREQLQRLLLKCSTADGLPSADAATGGGVLATAGDGSAVGADASRSLAGARAATPRRAGSRSGGGHASVAGPPGAGTGPTAPINPTFLRTPGKGQSSLSVTGISPITQTSSGLYKTPTKGFGGGDGAGGGGSSAGGGGGGGRGGGGGFEASSKMSTPGSLSPSPSIPRFKRMERRMSGRRFRQMVPRTILQEWITKAPTRSMWIIGRLRKHHRRWCVLRTDMRQGAVLVYFDSNSQRLQKRKGMVRIDHNARVVRLDETTFSLASAGRVFEGTCDTPEICSLWVTEITNCIRSQPENPAVVRTCC